MKPTPAGWPRISSALYYQDAAKAIDWLCKTFGFEVRLKIEEEGRIVHSELTFGDGLVMVGSSADPRPNAGHRKSPREVGGANTQNMMVFVDDVDAHCEHARAAGATIISEPKTSDYGEEYWTDRTYEVEDLEGHRWWFVQRMRG
ncbi:MAG: VOC family protein [Polyangiaceae bacterium]|nr:VOC family protein [Polyangiaceae bacterium]NUQ72632.1 VOC family protein [Polyangiaceae bacterium]